MDFLFEKFALTMFDLMFEIGLQSPIKVKEKTM